MEGTSLPSSRHAARSVCRGTGLGNYSNTGTESKDSFRTIYSALVSRTRFQVSSSKPHVHIKSLAMKPGPTSEAHPINYSLWARGCLLSPFSTTAVTTAGQQMLPSTGFSQQLAAVHRDQTSSQLCGTWRCAAAGTHFSTAFPGGTT